MSEPKRQGMLTRAQQLIEKIYRHDSEVEAIARRITQEIKAENAVTPTPTEPSVQPEGCVQFMFTCHAEPSLEDLALQAAIFLELISDEFATWSRNDAKHIAFALRARIKSARVMPDEVEAPDDTRLAEIREREQKTTAGPWVWSGPTAWELRERGYRTYVHRVPGCGDEDIPPEKFFVSIQSVGTKERDDADADFIANAKQDIPYLLSLVENLTRMLR